MALMHYFLLASTSLGVANAALQLDFKRERRTVSTSPVSRARRGVSRRDAVAATLDNVDQILYLMDVTVGTPPQKITLQLDTGSSDVWVPLTASKVCQTDKVCQNGAFDFKASKSFVDLEIDFNGAYGDGTQISGNYIAEDFGIGDALVKNFTMGTAITAVGEPAGVPYTGIVGVGFKAGEFGQPEFTYPTITEALKQQKLIDSEAYSLWLNDLDAKSGSILFGAVDRSKYHGDLVSLPIQPDADSTSPNHFTVLLDNIVVDLKSEVQYSAKNQAIPAIVDSGTSLTFLPSEIASAIEEGIGGVIDISGRKFVDCSFAKSEYTFTFGFGSSKGPKIQVPVSEMVIPFDVDGEPATLDDGTVVCKWGIKPAGDGPVILGDTFMRSAYVVFDLENNEIGIAQANFNGGKPDIVDIKSTIPGAQSTVNSKTVTQTASGNVQGTVGAPVSTNKVSATKGTGTFSLVTGTGAAASSKTHSAAAAATGPTHAPAAMTITLLAISITLVSSFSGILMILL